jgi:hypothetical protein
MWGCLPEHRSNISTKSTTQGVWVPAFAGTTRRNCAPCRNTSGRHHRATIAPSETFRDGDRNPRAPDRSYIRRVLFVRGASRGRSLGGAGCGACAMWFAPTSSGRPGVTVRANYVALPSMAGRGQDEGRRKLAGSRARRALVLSRKYGPPDTNRRGWSAVRRCASPSHGKRDNTFAPCGAPCPSWLEGQN